MICPMHPARRFNLCRAQPLAPCSVSPVPPIPLCTVISLFVQNSVPSTGCISLSPDRSAVFRCRNRSRRRKRTSRKTMIQAKPPFASVADPQSSRTDCLRSKSSRTIRLPVRPTPGIFQAFPSSFIHSIWRTVPLPALRAGAAVIPGGNRQRAERRKYSQIDSSLEPGVSFRFCDRRSTGKGRPAPGAVQDRPCSIWTPTASRLRDGSPRPRRLPQSARQLIARAASSAQSRGAGRRGKIGMLPVGEEGGWERGRECSGGIDDRCNYSVE